MAPIGRPKVDWTPSRKRKLVRLYLTTDMKLADICNILQDGEFQPKIRRTQNLLGDLLRGRYNALRPSDRYAMKQRMAEMRTCRNLSTYRTFNMQSTSSRPAPENSVSIFSTDPSSTQSSTGTGYGAGSSRLNKPLYMAATEDELSMYQAWLECSDEMTKGPSQDARDVGEIPSSSFDPRPSPTKLSTLKSIDVEGNFMDRPAVSREPASPRTGTSASKDILKRVSTEYTTSYIEDCVSLLARFSLSISDSSSIKSVFRLDKTSILGEGRPVTPINDVSNYHSGSDAVEHIVENQGPELASNDMLLYSCCRNSQDCIHRFVASLANQCPANSRGILCLSKSGTQRRDTFGNSPLHIAARWGTNLPVFESLISAHADVAATNSAGQTFLHLLDATCLLENGNDFFALFTLLHHYNFPFDVRDECGRTFLHSFLQNPEWSHLITPDLIERLLMMTVSWSNVWTIVHARDNTGWNVPTLLHWRKCSQISFAGREFIPTNPEYHSILRPYYISATESKRAELIPSGFCITDEEYFLHYNSRFDHQKAEFPSTLSVSNTLHQLAYPLNWPRSVRYAFEVIHMNPDDCNRYKLIDDIIEAGGDVNGYDEKGTTPLMAFISGFGSKEDVPDTDTDIKVLVRYLIGKGADIHRRDRRGETALHKAVCRGLKHTTELLLDRGSNIHARTFTGQGILLDAFERLRKAKSNEILYARILACLLSVIQRGGVGNPTVDQERRYNNRSSPST